MSRLRRRSAPDRIERYLRALRRWAPRASRNDLVREARRHLYEATCRFEREGMAQTMAQLRAIHDFGPAWRIGLAERGLLDRPIFSAPRRAAWAALAGARRLLPRRRLLKARARRPRPRMY